MIKQIQGIRALAICGIFICHTKVYISEDLGVWNIVLDQLGASGVFTFFMLSGFLFAYKGKEITKPKNPIKCAWKKVSKLYPLYLITFIMALIAKMPNTWYDWVSSGICAIFNLSMTQAFVPHAGIINSFNGPAWFLSSLFGIWIIIFLKYDKANNLLSFNKKRSLFWGGIFNNSSNGLYHGYTQYATRCSSYKSSDILPLAYIF